VLNNQHGKNKTKVFAKSKDKNEHWLANELDI
jgi:hypothetical protein